MTSFFRIGGSHAAIVGGGAGIVANSAFNVFRFGTVKNLLYLDRFCILDLPERLSSFSRTVSVAFSRFTVVLACRIVHVSTSLRHLCTAAREELPGLETLCIPSRGSDLTRSFLVRTCLVNFSPFGWVGYGLIVGADLAGAGIAIAHLVGDTIVDTLARFRTARVVMLLFFLLGLLQFNGPWRSKRGGSAGDFRRLILPSMIALDVYARAGEYYRCTTHVMWRLRPMTLDESSMSDQMSRICLADCGGGIDATRFPTLGREEDYVAYEHA